MQQRNWMLTLIVTLIICVILGMSVYIVQHYQTQINERSNICLFLTDASDHQSALVAIGQVTGVRSVVHIESEQLLAEFSNTLGYEWNGLNPLPDVVDIIVEPLQAQTIIGELELISAVDYVAYSQAALADSAELNRSLSVLSGVILLSILMIATLGILQIIRLVMERDIRCAQ